MGSAQSVSCNVSGDGNGYAVVRVTLPALDGDKFELATWVAENKAMLRQDVMPCRSSPECASGVKLEFFKWQWNIWIGLFASLQEPREPMHVSWYQLDALLLMAGGGRQRQKKEIVTHARSLNARRS